MSKLLDFLKAAAGEAALSSKLGIWRQKVSAEVEAIVSSVGSGYIYFYDSTGVALTDSLALDTWATLTPAMFSAGADNSAEVTLTADRRLLYSGPSKKLSVQVGLSIVATGGAGFREIYEVAIWKNGALVVGSSQDLTPGDVMPNQLKAGHVTCQIVENLVSGDILDIRLREKESGNTVTLVTSAYLKVA